MAKKNILLYEHGSRRIARNGYLHRLAAPRKIRATCDDNQCSTKSLVERLCVFKIYATSVLSFIGSVCAPDKTTLKAENHALQCTTAGPYNAITSRLLQAGSICGLGPDLVGIHSISLAARYRVAACSSTLREVWKKSVRHAGTIALLSLLYLPLGNRSFFFLPCLSSQRMHLTLFLGWTVMTHLMMCRKTKSRRLPLGLLLDKTP